MLLLCERVQDEPVPGEGSAIELCVQCRVEVWVSAAGRAPADARVRATDAELLILCMACGDRMMRTGRDAGQDVALEPPTPDQLRESFQRRMEVQRREERGNR